MGIDQIGVQPVVVTATPAMGQQTYRVAELAEDEPGEPSLEVSCTNDLSADGNVNYVHWRGEGSRFRVFRSTGGIFAALVDVTGRSFIDDGSIEVG